VVRCVKGNSAPTFAHPDKLIAHVCTIHYSKDAKAVYPANNCTDKVLTLDLLGVHIKSEHLRNRHDRVIRGMLRTIANAASADHHRYPL
jgi:cAMP phosphodiesterase